MPFIIHSRLLKTFINRRLPAHLSVDVGLLAARQICTHLPTQKMTLLPGIFITLVVRFTMFYPCHSTLRDGCDSALLHHRCFWLKRHRMNTVCMETLLYSRCKRGKVRCSIILEDNMCGGKGFLLIQAPYVELMDSADTWDLFVSVS